MAHWQQLVDEAPELAAMVRARLDATKHHVLGTLRADGSPRLSGTEVGWFRDDLVLGSMWEGVKAFDLRRDPRFALHTNPGDSTMAGGDAKLSGLAIEVDDAAVVRAYAESIGSQIPQFHLFVLDLRDVVLTTVAEDETHLLITTWKPGRPVAEVKRY